MIRKKKKYEEFNSLGTVDLPDSNFRFPKENMIYNKKYFDI